MKTFLTILLSLTITFSQEIISKTVDSVTIEELLQYNKWKGNNKKNYFNEEESKYRQAIFLQNLKQIKEHNNNATNSYEVGINQFSDLTHQEFAAIALNTVLQNSQKRNLQDTDQVDVYSDMGMNHTRPVSNPGQVNYVVPNSLDWRELGKISPVKAQGSCGSCWAFTTTGLFESINLIRNNTLQQYSEQELIDCASNAVYYNLGCNGGWPAVAHLYVQQQGISLESDYPYQSAQGNCTVNANTTKAFYADKPIYFNTVHYNNRTNAIQNALKYSPLAVLVDATKWANYKSGVFSDCSTTYNHAVLLVGYTSYGAWIVKNSWGTTWGDSGYIILKSGNTCGVLDNVMGSTI